MKICHVNLASGFSGGEQQTLQLIKRQVREGISTVLVVSQHGLLAKEAKRIGSQIILTKHFSRKHSKKLTQGCDVIHAHEGKAIYWAMLQHMHTGIPYIITRRIDNPIKLKLTNKLAYSKAAAVVGLSTEIVSKICEHFDPAKVHRIPSSPVDYPVQQNKVDQIWNAYRGKFLAIQAGRMLEHKGFQTTIAAAKTLSVTDPQIHFAFLGDGPMRSELEEMAKGLTNVSFVGREQDMGSWFAAANCLVHPSISEGLGSVILEAMQGGLPVIASNAGGIPDIVENNVTGLSFESENHAQLAQLLRKLEQDPSLCQDLIQGAKQKLKEFDISYTSKLYTELYQKVILAQQKPSNIAPSA